MTLKYNPTTYKGRKDPNNFLNSEQTTEGYAPEILTENYNDAVSIERSSDGTETATEDFILTNAQGSVYCGDNAANGAGAISVSYRGEIIFFLSVSTEVGNYLSQAGNANYPNWLIKKGETFTFNVTSSNGGGNAVLIGYKV